jgi:heme/copper-type cytochrome/quinol oxidase subunit 2
MNTTIATWTYQKGELVEKRFLNTILIFAFILCVIITIGYFIVLPNGTAFHLFTKTKIGGWFIVIPILIICFIVVLIFGALHNILFSVYKKLFTIKPEEISFTKDKIITVRKEWILNDAKRTLTVVKIVTAKKETFVEFSGIEKNKNGTDSTYKIEIPMPDEEIMKAEKIVSAFNF